MSRRRAEEEPRQKNSIRTSVEFISYVRQTLEETEESTKAQQHLDYVEKFLRKKLFFSNALVQRDLMSFFKKIIVKICYGVFICLAVFYCVFKC